MGSLTSDFLWVHVKVDVKVFEGRWATGGIVCAEELECQKRGVASIGKALKSNVDDGEVRRRDRSETASDWHRFDASRSPRPHLTFDDKALSPLYELMQWTVCRVHTMYGVGFLCLFVRSQRM